VADLAETSATTNNIGNDEPMIRTWLAAHRIRGIVPIVGSAPEDGNSHAVLFEASGKLTSVRVSSDIATFVQRLVHEVSVSLPATQAPAEPHHS